MVAVVVRADRRIPVGGHRRHLQQLRERGVLARGSDKQIADRDAPLVGEAAHEEERVPRRPRRRRLRSSPDGRIRSRARRRSCRSRSDWGVAPRTTERSGVVRGRTVVVETAVRIRRHIPAKRVNVGEAAVVPHANDHLDPIVSDPDRIRLTLGASEVVIVPVPNGAS